MEFLVYSKNKEAKIKDREMRLKFLGGKAESLLQLEIFGDKVPAFIVITSQFMDQYLKERNFSKVISQITNPKSDSVRVLEFFEKEKISDNLMNILKNEIELAKLDQVAVAVRSSGADEDSTEHSFAGMFSSFLSQKGLQDIEKSLRLCWASAYSERALAYRLENSLSVNDIKMGVVIQEMVDPDVSGVMFTRNPIDLLDRNSIIIDSVWGLGEGLVSGELDADHYVYSRQNQEITSQLAEKKHFYRRDENGSGISKKEVSANKMKETTLNNHLIKELSAVGMSIESKYKFPVDIEWAIKNDILYILQARPIANLPKEAFYDEAINGSHRTLWDNSNIVESFSGVTTPLTFSATVKAYSIVYKQTCRLLGVPENVISGYEYEFDHMLGFVRGRVYYNLINWYKLLLLIPGFSSNKKFMEQMMGVKGELSPKDQEIFDFTGQIPQYSVWQKLVVVGKLLKNFLYIDKVVGGFFDNFSKHYRQYRETDFSQKSLKELKKLYFNWEKNITFQWNAPILNDFLCMVFFGLLKGTTNKWVKVENGDTLQNDLLCGQGELESAMPTKMMMELAFKYDQNPVYRKLFLDNSIEDSLNVIFSGSYPEVKNDIDIYLDRYGFRCSNEQKLEENDLNDDPRFIISTLQGYIRQKNYSIEDMVANEHRIRNQAEKVVSEKLSVVKKIIYFWILKQARKSVANRENMRFLRTKSFGLSRQLFRQIGLKFKALGLLKNDRDIFYLSTDEIFSYIEGISISSQFSQIVEVRKAEYAEFENTAESPDRFLTHGTAGVSFSNMQIINSGDLLKNSRVESDDPNVFIGTSCCPGVVRGKVRLALTIQDAMGIEGEILIAKRTDPGWAPLYPSCLGLIVERGSLLSHSAVIARELGLPTIVGVSARLLDNVKTGDIVELNATKGEVRIIRDEI
jgi:phosphoenolpyruvate synthase/pyruvate phosphate dikinase